MRYAMKKRLIFIFCLMMSFSAFSKSMDFYWDFGSMNFGGNFSESAVVPVCDISVLDLRLESESGFACAFSPFNFSCILNKNTDDNNHSLSFFNFSVYYDFFKFSKGIEIEPFVSLHTCTLENFWNYTAETGFLVQIYYRDAFPEAQEYAHFRSEILRSRIGLKVQNGSPSFYLDVGFNILGFIACFAGR